MIVRPALCVLGALGLLWTSSGLVSPVQAAKQQRPLMNNPKPPGDTAKSFGSGNQKGFFNMTMKGAFITKKGPPLTTRRARRTLRR